MNERAPAEEIRFLNIIAIVAIVDILLLIPLVWSSRWIADNESVVGILGPIHGVLFLALIGLCAVGANRKWWGWWFPIITVVTLGPPGSLIGDFVIRRQLRQTAGNAGRTTAGHNASGQAPPERAPTTDDTTPKKAPETR